MSFNNIVEIHCRHSIEVSMSKLVDALEKPGTFEQILPTRVRLCGEVKDSYVRAYRARGRKQWYLHFEGQFSRSNGGSILKGTIVPHAPLFPSLIVNFLVIVAAIAFLSPIIWWKGTESLWQMVVGVLTALVAATAHKLYHINMKAEADLLRKDLEKALLAESV